uniref:Uncharacterized protein n=1 Tax=Ananas comosus var. bracteatus TaxID=296719 RepID=A0A6V7PR28_ANACO|nr:unnamed protein product [Ananas comosus var. bracteatus]
MRLEAAAVLAAAVATGALCTGTASSLYRSLETCGLRRKLDPSKIVLLIGVAIEPGIASNQALVFLGLLELLRTQGPAEEALEFSVGGLFRCSELRRSLEESFTLNLGRTEEVLFVRRLCTGPDRPNWR